MTLPVAILPDSLRVNASDKTASLNNSGGDFLTESKLERLKTLIEARYNAASVKDAKPEVAAALREILEHF